MHDCFTMELVGECLKCLFRLTRGVLHPRGVIESTMGAYSRGTGSNPVEGNGHFFPSYRQLYLSSFSDTHTHTHTPHYYEPCQEMLRSKSPALALKPTIISDHRINVSCSSFNPILRMNLVFKTPYTGTIVADFFLIFQNSPLWISTINNAIVQAKGGKFKSLERFLAQAMYIMKRNKDKHIVRNL